MENKMQTLDLFTATAANANLFNEENKAQKAHTRSTLGSTIKNAVQNALRYIEINYGGKALEISADEKVSILFSATIKTKSKNFLAPIFKHTQFIISKNYNHESNKNHNHQEST